MTPTPNSFWRGVLPALTTPFAEDGSVDRAFFAHHCGLMFDAGCSGIVPLGSLGETATLDADEKEAVIATAVAVAAARGRGAIVPGVAALSTAQAVRFAQRAHALGADGLMVLPPYVYSTDWREMKAHVAAVIAATPLPCLLYNNPIAYRTDFLPTQVAELAAEHPNLVAIKESSADVRRVSALKALLGERLHLLVGVDDMIVEGIAAGATGWVAGLVAAFPHESVRLFELARSGRLDEARLLYDWFRPLLVLDTVPKFVQLIKLVQQQVGLGHERVRAPRLVVTGAEREAALATIAQALGQRPNQAPEASR